MWPGWPAWAPSRILRSMYASCTWTVCSDKVCAGTWMQQARTTWRVTWWTISGDWIYSISPPCWLSSHCWMTMDDWSFSNGSTTTRTVLNQLQSGRLDQGDLRSNCRRGTRVDIGRHLRPSKLRPTCCCRCGSRFLRRRGRRTAATFRLSSRQTAAVKSLFAQLSCRVFHFAQSIKPTSPYPQRGRPGPKSRNRGSARLSLRSIGITMLCQQLRSVAAMPTPVDTRVGGNSHQKPLKRYVMLITQAPM